MGHTALIVSFQKLERCGLINKIYVKVKPFIPGIFFKAYTTKNNGMSVYCRNNPYLSHELNEILRDHGEDTESSESETESESSDSEYYYGWHTDYSDDSDSDYY